MSPKVTEKARNLRRDATEAEKCLWSKLQYRQLGVKFRRQHPIKPYIVDFCCLDKALVIEVDGGQHDENKKDEDRTAYLTSKGYKVIRFWNNEVLTNTEAVVEMIMNELNDSPPLYPPSRKHEGGEQKTVLPVTGKEENDWRADFPVLQQEMNGRPVSYLDTAASAQKPQAVIDAMNHVMETHYANVHRGLYGFSQQTTTAFEAVRGKVAAFIGAPSDQEIVFTRNATEAINLVAQSWGRTFLEEGDEVILTEMEHHANIVPWQMLREQTGIKLKIIPVLDDGCLDLEAFDKMLTHRTKLLSVVHVSNALGTINNVKKIIAIARDFYPNMKVLVDGSQAVVHGSVNVSDLGCDFYVFTGHKLYGPTGIGVLWGKSELLEAMPPYQGGGDMIETVSFDRTTYKKPPTRFEAGTPAIIEAIGLGAALDYMQTVGMDTIAAHEADLLPYAMDVLQDVGGLRFYGAAGPDKAGIISFTAEWGQPADIAMILDQCGVAVRAGHHCCQPLMKRFDLESTIRASFGLYTNKDDIKALAAGLNKAKEMLE